jgi:hypothetical protein
MRGGDQTSAGHGGGRQKVKEKKKRERGMEWDRERIKRYRKGNGGVER